MFNNFLLSTFFLFNILQSNNQNSSSYEEQIIELGGLYVDAWVATRAQNISASSIDNDLLRRYSGLLLIKKHFGSLSEYGMFKGKSYRQLISSIQKIEDEIRPNLYSLWAN